MVDFTPVEHDPFSQPAATDSARTTPVEYNPFAPSDTEAPGPWPVQTVMPRRKPAMEHIAGAIGDAFKGPYGPSEEFLKPFVSNEPTLAAFNRMVLGAGGTALDALGRPILAGIRGGSAALSEAAHALGVGDTEATRLERDLNVGGDIAATLLPQAATIPKVSVTTDAGGGLKAAGQSIVRKVQDSPLVEPVRKGMQWMWDVNKVDPEKTAVIDDITAKGGRVPIEQWAPTATYLGRLTQIAKGWGYDPVKEAGVPFYEREAGQILGNLGVGDADRSGLTKATSAVPLAPAGEAAVGGATKIIGDATNELNRKVDNFKTGEIGPATRQARERARDISTEQNTLVFAADQAREQANRAVQQGFTEINRDLDAALAAPEAQTGTLMRAAEGRLRDLRQQVGRYFRGQYDAADEAAAGHYPDATGLAPWARGMLDALLPPVRAQYPREVELLTRLAPAEEAAAPTGLLDQFGRPTMREPTPAEPITFGQLHELRNWVRHVVDWDDLAAGPKQGVLKLVEREINQVLHDQEASPELQTAARMLDATDREYGQVIPRFKDTVVRQIVRSGTAAAPENAAKLASMVITEGNTERIGMIRDMVGPEVWRQVQAADLRSIVAHSLDQTGQFDMQAFAKKIMERSNLGMLQPTYGPEAANLIRQARRVQQTTGRFDAEVLPGDTVTTLLQRADNAIQRAEMLAEQDPIGLLKQHVKKVEGEAEQMKKEGQTAIEKNPLTDLLDLPAEKATQRIFANPDLLRSAQEQFGPASPEFTLLRQTWARQFLQRDIDSVRNMPAEFAEHSRDVQQALFPGTSLDDMIRLTKEMKVMFPKGEDATSIGMSGMAMLFNPSNASFMPHWARALMKAMPAQAIARATVGMSLGKVADIATSPALMRFVTRGLTGTPVQQDAARAVMVSVLAGAPVNEALAMGATVLAHPLTESPPEQEPEEPRKNWREMMGVGRKQSPWMQKLRGQSQPATSSPSLRQAPPNPGAQPLLNQLGGQ